jgi:hypothetical protein
VENLPRTSTGKIHRKSLQAIPVWNEFVTELTDKLRYQPINHPLLKTANSLLGDKTSVAISFRSL